MKTNTTEIMRASLGSRGEQREGATIFLVMIVLSLLAVLSATSYQMVRSETRISRQQHLTTSSLNHAEGAAHYYIKIIEDGLAAGTITMGSAVEYVSVNPPTGINAEPLTKITRTPNPRNYTMEVTGSDQDAETKLEVTIRRRRLMDLGLFGDSHAVIQPNVHVYSYRSSQTSNPTVSTGEANFGSNEEVDLLVGVLIDGIVLLGEDLVGTESDFSYKSIYDHDYVDRIDPDPLGIATGSGGDLDLQFVAAASTNDNSLITSLTGSGGIKLNGAGSEISLTAGTYYLKDVELGPQTTLNVDTSSGPVKIFTSGSFKAAPDSVINMNGNPIDFQIYSSGTHPDVVDIQPNGDFKGTIYAPFTSVSVKPSVDFYGVAWGETLNIQPGGNIWIDADLLDERLSMTVEPVAWKEVRE